MPTSLDVMFGSESVSTSNPVNLETDMKYITQLATMSPLLFAGACADVENAGHDHHDHDHHDHNHGLITTLVLNFTAEDGTASSFSWSDPEDDGDPMVDDIVLSDASDHDHHDTLSYTVDVEIWNDLEDPAEDVTGDIAEFDTELARPCHVEFVLSTAMVNGQGSFPFGLPLAPCGAPFLRWSLVSCLAFS